MEIEHVGGVSGCVSDGGGILFSAGGEMVGGDGEAGLEGGGGFDEGGDEAGGDVPFDVAMEEPDAFEAC